jgi:hypothetical protein
MKEGQANLYQSIFLLLMLVLLDHHVHVHPLQTSYMGMHELIHININNMINIMLLP